MERTKVKESQGSNIFEDVLSASAKQITEIAMEEIPDSPLVNRKQQREKLELEVKNSLREHFNKIENGASHIFLKLVELANNEPNLLSEKIIDEIKNFGVQTGDLFEKAGDFLSKIEDNKSWREIYQLSDETMEAFYKAAAEIYREKRYQEAAEAFSVLAILDPDVYLFWCGLGNSEYFCHQFNHALNAYGMAIQLNPTEPLNYVFSANCYEAIHDYNNALNSLDGALSIIDRDKDNKYKDIFHQLTEQKKIIESKLK